MNINSLTSKVETLFLELGFKNETIGEMQYFTYNNCYCKITYLKKLRAFVIESASDINDAIKGVLEDGDLYYVDISEKAMLHQLREDIVAYYMD